MSNQNNTTLAERTQFLLPDMVDNGGFSQEELAEDMDGLNLGFQRVKIPGGGILRFELPGDDPDNPEYVQTLEGVILHSHNANVYWPEGSEYDDNIPPQCQSDDGKLGVGCPGGLCASCGYNVFGTGPNGKGKACKNMRVLYLLQSGGFMPIQLSLPPTSIKPYTNFLNSAFLARRRGLCGSVVRISLKKENNGKDDYSVARFERLYDFTGEELARVKACAESFKEQLKLIQEQRAIARETNAGSEVEMGRPARVMPDNEGHFSVGATIVNGEYGDLPD